MSVVMLGGGTAHADPQDTQFLDTLRHSGVAILDPADRVDYAHHICDDMAGGIDFKRTIDEEVIEQDPGLGPLLDATPILIRAIHFYCPQFYDDLPDRLVMWSRPDDIAKPRAATDTALDPN